MPILRLTSTKVSSAVRSTALREPSAGASLLADLVAVDEAGADQEVAHGGGDIGLELVSVVPTEYLRGGLGDFGVVGVDVYGQGVVLPGDLRLAQMGVAG